LAISPPSDIVLDVARAADPAEIATARLQLERRGAAAAGAVSFAAVARTDTPSATDAAANSRNAGIPKAYRKFEAVVLQTFMKSIMPKDSDAVFGKGLAGDMWKSQLAEQLGNVLADRGGIGIANRLLKDRYVEGDRTVPLTGASDGQRKADADMKRMLSVALVQEMQRRMTNPVGPDTTAHES
jgi:Rod binding domain-containing protein